jgi:hypothetical protein
MRFDKGIDLRDIVTEYGDFLEDQVENNPHLLLKYPVNKMHIRSFVFSIIAQIWQQKPLDDETTLQYMMDRMSTLEDELF